MPPKQTKKAVSAPAVETTSAPSLDTLKQEWMVVVKDISTHHEKLALLEKRRDELVTKLWEHMNKNPQEQVITPVVEEKKATKGKKTTEPVEQPVEPPVEQPVEPPKKSKTTRTKQVEEKKPVVEEPVAKGKTQVKTPVKKVSAPSKGTPKRKVDIDTDEEKPKPVTHDSSSETDLESLSSVSESDGSDVENDND